MKNILKLTLCITLFLLGSSCSKWLDVKPETEVKSEEQFLSEQGFKDAVFGCYILMSAKSLYGMELSTNFIEVLAGQYDFKSTQNKYFYASQYRYDMVFNKSIIDNLWLNMYNTIANVNNIIENLETNRRVLQPTTYALIKGEMYGLRAYLHFDLLRMFGHSNLAGRSDKMQRAVLPYIRNYKNELTKQHTNREILDFIYDDLAIASDCLSKYDPMKNDAVRPDDYRIERDDKFFTDRKYRFNYYASLATLMRAKLWEGNYSDAKVAAKKIIDEAEIGWIEDGVINNATESYRDLCFVTEQIFGLETAKRMDDIIKPTFKLKSENTISDNTQCLFHLKSRATKLYEIGEDIGTSDYRYTRLYNKQNTEYEILKFWEYENMLPQYVNNLPLIKKAEIYYVMAECLNSTGSDTDRIEAIGYLNQVRRARGIVQAKDLSVDLTNKQVEEEILKEWRKEFVSEGHLFYHYKRIGANTISESNVAMDDPKYMFPIPENEINFGGRIDENKK